MNSKIPIKPASGCFPGNFILLSFSSVSKNVSGFHFFCFFVRFIDCRVSDIDCRFLNFDTHVRAIVTRFLNFDANVRVIVTHVFEFRCRCSCHRYTFFEFHYAFPLFVTHDRVIVTRFYAYDIRVCDFDAEVCVIDMVVFNFDTDIYDTVIRFPCFVAHVCINDTDVFFVLFTCNRLKKKNDHCFPATIKIEPQIISFTEH
jgi:hypothetical protein